MKSLVWASEISTENPDLNLVIRADKKPEGEHSRRYNSPTGSEVAVILPGEQVEHLDVVLQTKAGEIQHINAMHRSYDPLHYVILFPYGDDGYHEKLYKTGGTNKTSQPNRGSRNVQSSEPRGPSNVPSAELSTPMGPVRWFLSPSRITKCSDGSCQMVPVSLQHNHVLRWFL